MQNINVCDDILRKVANSYDTWCKVHSSVWLIVAVIARHSVIVSRRGGSNREAPNILRPKQMKKIFFIKFEY